MWLVVRDHGSLRLYDGECFKIYSVPRHLNLLRLALSCYSFDMKALIERKILKIFLISNVNFVSTILYCFTISFASSVYHQSNIFEMRCFLRQRR